MKLGTTPEDVAAHSTSSCVMLSSWCSGFFRCPMNGTYLLSKRSALWKHQYGVDIFEFSTFASPPCWLLLLPLPSLLAPRLQDAPLSRSTRLHTPPPSRANR